MSTLTSASPSATAAFHRRYSRPSPRSPVPRPSSNTSSPIFGAPSPSHAPSPVSRPHMTDAGTQYTPEAFPPTAHKFAGSKRRGSSPESLFMTSQPDSSVPDRSADGQPPADGSADILPVQHDSPSLSKRPRTRPTESEGHAESTETRPSAHPQPPPPGTRIMPIRYETCNPKDLGYLISNMLMELIRLNDKLPLNGRLTRFHSRAPPGISCHDYLQRLIQHATLSPPILLSIVYYIDRLCALYPAFTVSSLTVHRFLITAATVAAKGLSDSFWTNPTYARIGGISVSELATLEMEFLEKVQWRIVPKPEVLVDYYVSLVQRSDGFQLEESSEPDSEHEPT